MTALDQFSAPTRAWFEAAFGEPTPVQVAAWEAIAAGRHALVIAPTGSGKTLAAFLAGIDALLQRKTTPPGVSVLYVSPLKALGVDVERNLRRPLAGITAYGLEQGLSLPDVRIGVRSGDTPAAERRRLTTQPPDILITTPESLFLMLSSGAKSALSTVRTVIVDEIHCLAGTKRGAHLAVSLERLEGLTTGGVQRIGLSATVRPPEVVARFLGGRDRPVTVVAPPMPKRWELTVTVPGEEVTRVWPVVEEEIFGLIQQHRSTICFCNSRGVAERLTNHLNQLYQERVDPGGILARTHHGSIAKGLRLEIEGELKAGRLACVVATNSLELGIDMGAVDLVIQVGAPPSVASGLQRIGRGGHHVAAVSHGVLFPLSRGETLATAVVTERMAAGAIESVHRLTNPLDVLAQHLVSMCLDAPQAPETLAAVVRGADPFVDLPDKAFDGVVAMLTGRYPSDDFAELRPRLAWQAGALIARPGARRLVTTSGGTIPDRGQYEVFIAPGEGPASGRHAVSRRVGELDEEMVYESRVGEVFTLGTSAWRIEQITANQVIVSPVPGLAGKLPFWHGDERSRPAELGWAIQARVAALGQVESDAVPTPAAVAFDAGTSASLLAYVREQRAATGVLPDDATIVVERTRDELGAWRAVVHCQLGRAVLQPWAMAIQHALRRRSGADPKVFVTDDGIVIRLGEVARPSLADALAFDPDEITGIVAAETEHSALFAAHFRQCAARALLLPRRDPGQRTPLWQQRLRSNQLLGVAAAYPDFPIMAESLRECLQDQFDLPALRELMTDLRARRIRLVEVETPRPSPFAANVLFGYTGAFLYDDDQPLAERWAAASVVDPDLLASLLGTPPEQLDPVAVAEVAAEVGRLVPSRRARTAEALWDMVRELGPLTVAECTQRCEGDGAAWLAELTAAGRMVVGVAGETMVVVPDDAALLSPAADRRTLVSRWLRYHAVVTYGEIARRYGWEDWVARAELDALVAEGRVVSGRFLAADSPQYVLADTLARIRRRAVARLRAAVKPVTADRFAAYLLDWAELDRPGSGPEGLLAAVEQLAGYPVPASLLETVVLPARVRDYRPALLDEAMLAGDVIWSGHGAIGDVDGWVCLWPGDMAPLLPATPVAGHWEAAQAAYDQLGGGGAWSAADLAAECGGLAHAEAALLELLWSGLISADTLAPLRARRTGVLRRVPAPRPRRVVRPVVPRPASVGRWFVLGRPDPPAPETARLVDAVGLELNRYGILTRGSVLTEALTPAFSDAYKVLAGLEAAGTVRRGYFVADLGAAQFALPGAVDRLREDRTVPPLLLAACDPANPWGAALPWPATAGHRPTRTPGALVVLVDARPAVYLERGTHTLLTFEPGSTPGSTPVVATALRVLGDWIDAGRLDTVTLTRINGDPALSARAWHPLLEEAGFTMTPQGFRRRATTEPHPSGSHP